MVADYGDQPGMDDTQKLRPDSQRSVERILDGAEKAFAARGFEGASLRDIIAEAGVANGAIHYHFKTKEDLFRRVIRRRAQQISKLRIEKLEQCRVADDRPPLLEQIIYAFMSTLVSPELGNEDARYRFARLRAWVVNEYSWPNASPLGELAAATDQRYLDMITGDQSHLPREEARRRFTIMWCAVHDFSSAAARAALDEADRKKNIHPMIDFEEQIPWLVTIFATMFRAPAGANDGFSAFLERLRDERMSDAPSGP